MSFEKGYCYHLTDCEKTLKDPKVKNIIFYFDPMCPWTYVASKWIREVHRQTHIPLEFRPFSLSIKNRGVEVPEIYREPMKTGLRILRIVMKLREDPTEENQRLISDLYANFGKQVHEMKESELNVSAILDASGIVSDVQKYQYDEELDLKIEAEMQAALAFTGEDVGVPIIAFETESETQGFFGPILCRVPTETEALELWTHFQGLASLGCFFEIKRKKFGGPIVS